MKKLQGLIDYFIFTGDRSSNVELRKGRFFVCTVLLIIVIGLLNVVYFLGLNNALATVGSAIDSVLSFAILVYYRHKGKRILLVNIFNIMGYILVCILIYRESGGIYSSDLMFFVVTAAWTFLIANRQSGLAWFLISLVLVVTFYLLEGPGEKSFLAAFMNQPPEYSLMNYCVVLVFMYFIVSTHDKNQRTYIDEIEKKQAEIEQKNKEIIDSIRYAERIQRAQLPAEKIVDKNLKRLTRH
ncbi:MAG TPA: hypothetical protein VD905_08890 [Flavobacteriales bacterium]|nr:hypothetical protein [Flavobacteriales bacterium]